MNQAEIKKIREDLNLTQEQLATILGVTKAAVTRYEAQSEKSYSAPQAETEKKLIQLQTLLANANDKKKLINLRHQEGGIASLAGLIAIGAATFPIAAKTLKVLPFGLGILGAAAALGTLGNFITSILKEDN